MTGLGIEQTPSTVQMRLGLKIMGPPLTKPLPNSLYIFLLWPHSRYLLPGSSLNYSRDS